MAKAANAAKSKRLGGLTAGIPAADAARTALAARLGAVRHALGGVEARGAPPGEVRQLRVAARRAEAVLSLFAGLLDPDAAGRLKSSLRATRKLAGKARDLDLLAERVRPGPTGPQLERHEALVVGYAAGLRERAAGKLLAEAPGLDRALGKRGSRLLDALDRADDRSFGELALGVLADQLTAFDFATSADPARAAGADGFHAVRVLAKAARYTLELAADCLPGGVATEYLSSLAGLQATLGRLQDSAVTAGQLARVRRAAGVYLAKSSDALRAIRQVEKHSGADLGAAATALAAWRADWNELRERAPVAPAQNSPTNPEPPAPLPEPPGSPPASRPARRRAPRAGG